MSLLVAACDSDSTAGFDAADGAEARDAGGGEDEDGARRGDAATSRDAATATLATFAEYDYELSVVNTGFHSGRHGNLTSADDLSTEGHVRLDKEPFGLSFTCEKGTDRVSLTYDRAGETGCEGNEKFRLSLSGASYAGPGEYMYESVYDGNMPSEDRSLDGAPVLIERTVPMESESELVEDGCYFVREPPYLNNAVCETVGSRLNCTVEIERHDGIAVRGTFLCSGYDCKGQDDDRNDIHWTEETTYSVSGEFQYVMSDCEDEE